MQAVFEIHWIEVYWFFCSCYLAETTSPLMGPNHLFSLLMYQNICFMGGPFPSKLENFQFCDNENIQMIRPIIKYRVGMVFLSPNGKYNLSLSNCQAKWSSIPALDWIKKMCVTYFFDFFQTTYIDKTHQSTVNKICSKKGNFFTLFIDFRFAAFFNSN